MTLPKSGGPEWVGSQATPHTTVNESLRRVDAGANRFLVVDKDLSSPPGSCADGACYIVASGASGAWAGHTGDIAEAVGPNASSGWYFRDPEEGLEGYVQDENLVYRASTGTSPVDWTALPDGYIAVEEAGVEASSAITRLNFTGSGVSVSVVDNEATIDVPGGSGGSGAGFLNDMDDVDTSGAADGYALTYDSGVSPPQWVAAHPNLSYSRALCSADTALSNSGWTDVTGCSLTLDAGTWEIDAVMNIANGSTVQTAGARIYNSTDSTNIFANQVGLSNGFGANIALKEVVVLAGTKTIKLAGRTQTASATAKQYGDPNIGAANIPGTIITAKRLA